MPRINDGGYAFPSALDSERAFVGSEGMTLRDWFAGQAVMSLVTELHLPPSDGESGWADNVAGNAYRLADAMLRAREAQS